MGGVMVISCCFASRYNHAPMPVRGEVFASSGALAILLMERSARDFDIGMGNRAQ